MWSREIPDFNYGQNAMIMSNIKYCIRNGVIETAKEMLKKKLSIVLAGILFLAGIIVFGCNEDRQNEKDSDIFQINIPLTSGDKPLFADSLFCGKEIVPLETTPECLISQIDKLEIADDKLYLLDDEQDFIFIFSRQGKFIHGSSPIYMTDEYMVNFIEASFLVSYREQEGKIPELTQEWELNIKEEDNPCLYFYKLKNWVWKIPKK